MKLNWKTLVPFLFFLLMPLFVTDSYFLKIFITFGIYAILAYSLNFIVGYIGEISFGHAAFFGLGAYFSVLLMVHLNMNFWLSVVLAIVLTGVAGFIVGFLSFRLQGVHFAICTLAFAEIIRLIILNMDEWTRGAMGISVSRSELAVLNLSFTNDSIYYYLVFFAVVFIIMGIKLMFKTPFGRSMIAIRESASLASSIGIHVSRYKIIAFVISTMIAAIAGILYAPFVGIISPSMLSVHYTATGLLMVILGGRGYLYGPLFGAFIFTIIPEVFWMSPEVQLLVFGLLLLFAILFMPRGIASLLRGKNQSIKLGKG